MATAKKTPAPKKPNFKTGSFYNYKTPRGLTGRMKVTFIETRTSGGTWITGTDKDTKKELTLRPGCLSA